MDIASAARRVKPGKGEMTQRARWGADKTGSWVLGILIAIPVLMPAVTQLGIDPVHFGLVVVLNLMIGLLHPPMGMVLYVLARVARMSLERTTMAILPWLVPLLGSLILITYVPQISLWLPRMFYQ